MLFDDLMKEFDAWLDKRTYQYDDDARHLAKESWFAATKQAEQREHELRNRYER